MPETAEAAMQPGSLVEALPRGEMVNQLGQRAETFLHTPDARAITSLSARLHEVPVPERNTETFFALRDKQTNTSFVVSSRSGYTEGERVVTIRFQTLGEHKGELGGGVIRLTYKNGQQEPIDVASEKVDNVHLLQTSDEAWLSGDPVFYTDVAMPNNRIELADTDVGELLRRLPSDKIEIDSELTERAAKHADTSYRLTASRVKLDEAKRTGNREEIMRAEQSYQEAASAWNKLWQEILQRLRPVTQIQTQEVGSNKDNGQESALQQTREELGIQKELRIR